MPQMAWFLDAGVGCPNYFLVRCLFRSISARQCFTISSGLLLSAQSFRQLLFGCGDRLPVISFSCAAALFDAVLAPSCGQRLDLRLPAVGLGDLCNHAIPNG